MTVFQNVKKGLIPARLTVGEVYALQDAGVIDDRERFELIEGEIVPMAAAKLSDHERMKSRLVRRLNEALSARYQVYVETSIQLDRATLVEPDIAVWEGDPDSQDVRGPDILLLIEVSYSSIAYDIRVKAPLYAAHGVREYWVVDAVRKTIRVHRAPSTAGYDDVEEYEAHDEVAALLLPGVTVRLDRLD